MYYNRTRKKHNNFFTRCVNSKITPTATKLLKSKRCLIIYLVASREYTYKMTGRCMSFRSQGKISSLLIRNFSYGVEQRIFINNPRLGIYFLTYQIN